MRVMFFSAAARRQMMPMRASADMSAAAAAVARHAAALARYAAMRGARTRSERMAACATQLRGAHVYAPGAARRSQDMTYAESAHFDDFCLFADVCTARPRFHGFFCHLLSSYFTR